MEEIQFNKLYNFDKERLYSNYERIQNLNTEMNSKEIAAKFLDNQSIGNSTYQILEVLTYFETRLSKDKYLIDFAFEWLRANKIRLEYKRYIILSEYKAYTTALDDIIFLFFLKYDEILRPLFQETIEEHELCTLYQIFFNPQQTDTENLNALLDKNKKRVPTIRIKGEKIITTIHTLREGLSEMIEYDFTDTLPSEVKILNYQKTRVKESGVKDAFNGTMIERLVKFYCFQKRKIDTKEFTMAINQFLSSYFQYGKYYNFDEFKEKLISSFADYIHSGLTKEFKDHSIDDIKKDFSLVIEEFENTLKDRRLKGKAWIEDLKPILQDFIEKFVDKL